MSDAATPILLDMAVIWSLSCCVDSLLVSAMVVTFARDVSNAEPMLTADFAIPAS